MTEYTKLPSLLAILLVAHVTSVHGEAPPPGLGRLDTEETNKTMDQLITDAYGSIDQAANAMLGEDSEILAELDMYLTKDQFLTMYEPPKESDMKTMQMYPQPLHSPVSDDGAYVHENKYGVRSKRKATKDPRTRWTRATMPYTIADGHFTAKEEYMMLRSMTEWERYTCLNFRPAVKTDRNIVRFQNGQGCNSQLGMVGGVQILNLQAPGCRYKGLYLHEIGHAVGLVHEHQLPDRDNYIDILYHNVDPHMRIWFNKYSINEVDQMKVEYQLSSVMHYGITAFSYNGKAQTIRAKDQSKEELIGRVYLKELAFSDAEIVNYMYNCSGHCDNVHKCGKDGFLDQNCNCICKDGSSDTCDITKTADPNCKNDYDSWSCYIWANQGECERNAGYMHKNCKKACNICGNKKAPHCKDAYQDKCKVWKSRGDCVTNRSWMKSNCALTCKLCTDGVIAEEKCSNKEKEPEKCDGYARDGECQISRDWMLENCKKSCRFCKGDTGGTNKTGPGEEIECVNKNTECESWAQRGECTNNPNWMNNNCRKACKKCEDGTCKNLYDDTQCDIWEQKQQCINSATWMRRFCAKACGHGPCYDGKGGKTTVRPVTSATGVTGATSAKYRTTHRPRPTTPTTGTGDCKNIHNSDTECAMWAKHDHCNINPAWMHKRCAKACGVCTTTGGKVVTTDSTGGGTIDTSCRDSEANCVPWAKNGYCDTNSAYNLIHCRKSCNNCNGCRDTQALCKVWASGDHCRSNPNFMLRHCQKSCNVCSK